MKTVLLIAAPLGLLGVTAWWINDVVDLGGFNMPAAGWIALASGAVCALALGVGLMFLMFRSNRKGQDEPPEVMD
jgi:hypothetical protein